MPVDILKRKLAEMYTDGSSKKLLPVGDIGGTRVNVAGYPPPLYKLRPCPSYGGGGVRNSEQRNVAQQNCTTFCRGIQGLKPRSSL